MSNVSLELQKQAVKSGMLRNKLDYFGEYAKVAAPLEKMRHDVSSGAPTSEDDMSDLFAGMRKEMGSGPQRGVEALLSGVLTGASLGAKAKGNEKRRENAEKSSQFFEYLQETAKSAMQRREQAEKKNQFQQFIQPQLQAYAKTISAMSDSDARKSGEELTDQYNQFFGSNKRLGVFDKQQGIAILTENGKPDQKVNLFEMFPEVQQEKTIATLTERAYAQEQLENQQRQARIDNQADGNDIKRDNIEARLEGIGLKSTKEIVPRATATHKIATLSGDLIKDADDHPALFGSALQAIVATGGDTSAFKQTIDTGFVEPKNRDVIMRVYKGLNQVMVQEAKSQGGQNNMTIDKWITGSMPNMSYSAKNFKYLMQEMKLEAELNNKIYVEAMNTKNGKHLYDAYHEGIKIFEEHHGINRQTLDDSYNPKKKDAPTSPANPLPLTPEESKNVGKAVMPAKPANIPEGFILMVNPVSKVEQWIPPEGVGVAEKRGAVRK